MGQSNGVLLKEVAAFQRCSLTEVSLYSYRECSACEYGRCPATILCCPQRVKGKFKLLPLPSCICLSKKSHESHMKVT